MTKLTRRVIGFVAFVLIFGCVLVGVLLVSTGVIDARAMFPNMNLPEPPQLDTSGIPEPDFSVPDVTLPDIPGVEVPDVLLPGDQVYVGEAVTRREITSDVPAPQQVSTEPQVIGTNMFYAILMALIFGATSTVLGNMLRDEEPRIRAWLSAAGIDGIFEWIGGLFDFTLGRAVRRGCLTLPLIVMIFALYGIIFAFLEEGTSLFTPEGATLAILMAFTVGLVSFAGDVARRLAGRFWRTKTRFNLYPANLGIAMLTVAGSRLFHLSPGIAFGTPGGADVDIPPEKAQQREGVLALLEVVMVAAVGLIGWAISGAVFAALDVPIDERAASTLGGVLSAVQNGGLAVFFVALETAFFEMLPLAYGTGQSLLGWRKGVWALLFVPITFLFNHTLLNPQSGFLDSFMVPNVRFLWGVLFVLVAVTAGLWFYFNVLDDVLQEWAGIRQPRQPR